MRSRKLDLCCAALGSTPSDFNLSPSVDEGAYAAEAKANTPIATATKTKIAMTGSMSE
jgi:hypothetical protein